MDEIKQTKDTEKFTYIVEEFDNGISLRIPEQEYYECEKFSNKGKTDDEAIIKFLGKNLWQDIRCFCDEHLTSNVKLELRISE